MTRTESKKRKSNWFVFFAGNTTLTVSKFFDENKLVEH